MLRIRASDATGQKAVDVLEVEPDWTVGELVRGVIPRLDLPANDSYGGRLNYQARLPREERHLFASERVGDALQPGDAISILPSIDAGAAR